MFAWRNTKTHWFVCYFWVVILNTVTCCLSILLVTLPVAAQEATDSKPQIAFIIAGVEDARDHLKSFVASVDTYYYERKEVKIYAHLIPQDKKDNPKFKQDTETTRKAQWYVSGNSETVSIDKETDTDKDKDNNPFVYSRLLVSDGTIFSCFDKYQYKLPTGELKLSHSQGVVMSHYMFDRQGVRDAFDEVDPRYLAYQAASSEPIDVALAGSYPCFYWGKEVQENTICLKVERRVAPEQREFYWIDPDHSFLVRRVEVRRLVAGKTYSSTITKVPRVQESGGVWLPAVIETEVRFAVPTSKETGKQDAALLPLMISRDKLETVNGVLTLPAEFERITISALKVNQPIPPEKFVMVWPPNAMVYDRVAGAPVKTTPDDTIKKPAEKTNRAR